jgi:hypothetical protein
MHPAFEPHLDVAAALAQPGITWTSLCSRGLGGRHLAGREQDLADYLQVWCTAAQHDAKAALFQLGKLRSSPIPGMYEAIVNDAVNILADHGASDDVESILTRSGLLELEIVDRLAVAYQEVGRTADAFAMNDLATKLDRSGHREAECLRLVRARAFGVGSQKSDAVRKLVTIVAGRGLPAAACNRLWSEVQCADEHQCELYWSLVQNRGPEERALASVLTMWPTKAVDAGRWYTLAHRAEAALPLEGTYVLAIPALELALRASGCKPLVASISMVARDLSASPHDAKYDRALRAVIDDAGQLAAAAPEQCSATIAALPPVAP